MDREDDRIESLERRLGRLEHRIARLEALRPGQDLEPPGVIAEAPAPPVHPGAVPPSLVQPGAVLPGLVQPGAVLPPPSPVHVQRPVHRVPPVPAPTARPAWGAPAPGAVQSVQVAQRVTATQPVAPAPEAAPPRASLSLKDLEERFGGLALAVVGGFAVIAGIIAGLSYAFDRGWITEPMRVLIGVIVGVVAFGLGGLFLARRNAVMGTVLTGVGLGIISIAMLAATTVYHLVPPELGLLVALGAAVAAAVVAIRFDARLVAVFGLVAALAAPPLVGAPPTLGTLAFVAIVLVGTTAIALFRSWRWLPPLAFVLAAPQLASWLIGDAEPVQALVALAGFWLVNIVAAAGEEVRIRRDDLRPSSATLVLANATFLLWGLLVVLDGDLHTWLGTAIALASLAHLLLGAWFLQRQGMEHLFGNLTAGTGVALLAIAAFVQLGAPAVPVAWAAEATALAWLAVRRLHRWSAGAGLILGGLAIAHLVLVEYPLYEAGIPAAFTFDPALFHPETASLAAVLLALVVSGAVVPVRWIRSSLAATGILLVAYAATFDATGPVLAAALVLAALAGLLLDRLAARLPGSPDLEPIATWSPFAWYASLSSLVAGAMAVVLLLSTEFPPADLGTVVQTPFLNTACLSLLVVLVGLLAAGVLVPVRWIRSAFVAVGILLAAWAVPFEVDGVAQIALLAVLLPVGVVADRGLQRLPEAERFARASVVVPVPLLATVAGAIAWVLAALEAVGSYLNPLDWGSVTPPTVPFSDERALVGALLAGALLVAVRWLAPMSLRRIAVLAAIATAAWVVPFEVYADLVVVLWVALAAAAVLVTRWDSNAGQLYEAFGSALWIGGAGVAFGIVARPDRLWVVNTDVVDRVPLLALWWLAFAALALAMYLAPRHRTFTAWRTTLELAAGGIVLYAVSIGIVDAFQRQVGGTVAVEELAKQAQLALSVCWASVGAALLLAGFTRHRAMLRHAGFGVLGMAAVKVFVVDLASMDVAYRALVLAGLGALLLVSAGLVIHFRGPRAGPSGIAGGPRPAA